MTIISGVTTSNLRQRDPPNPLAQTFSFDSSELTGFATLSNGDRTITKDSGNTFAWGVTDVTRPQAGQYIFEFEISGVDTFYQCGIALSDTTFDDDFAGQPYGSTILTWTQTRHYNGALSTDFEAATHVKNPAVNDIYTCAIDFDLAEVSWYCNGSSIVIDEPITLDAGKSYIPHSKVFNSGDSSTIPTLITYTRSGFTTW